MRQVKSYKNAGIEGWFKVETIAALQDCVKEVRNKSPDLVVEVQENRVEITLIARAYHSSTSFQIVLAS